MSEYVILRHDSRRTHNVWCGALDLRLPRFPYQPTAFLELCRQDLYHRAHSYLFFVKPTLGKRWKQFVFEAECCGLVIDGDRATILVQVWPRRPCLAHVYRGADPDRLSVLLLPSSLVST
jgi:hypothetical protein